MDVFAVRWALASRVFAVQGKRPRRVLAVLALGGGLVACDLLGPGGGACSPYCVVSVEVDADVRVARPETVAVVVSDGTGPVQGVAVVWEFAMEAPCGAAGCTEWALTTIGRVAPVDARTGQDGRARAELTAPGLGRYRLVARSGSGADSARIRPAYPEDDGSGLAWTRLPDLPYPGQGIAAALLDGAVYLTEVSCSDVHGVRCGPVPGGERTHMDVLETATEQWVEAPLPPTDHGWGDPAPNGDERIGAAASLDGRVHLVRGARHLVYDPESRAWSGRAAPPEVGRQPVLLAAGARLYLVGTGEDRRGAFAYDPDADDWSATARTLEPRSAAAAAVLDGRIYVAGGYGAEGGSDAVERYDPATDAWEALEPMPLARGRIAGGAVGRRVCVFGGGFAGIRAGQGHAETYCYDVDTGMWALGPQMPWGDPPGTVLVAAAGDGETVYAFGGGMYSSTGFMYHVRTAARLEAVPD